MPAPASIPASAGVDRRQVVRVVAVVLALVVLGAMAWLAAAQGGDEGADAASTEDPTSYAGIAAGVQRQLEVYGALSESIVQHSQAHALQPKLEGIESSLGVLRDRALELGTDDGEALAVLADFIRLRGADVRDAAARDHLGVTGIQAQNAFGREVSLRAQRMADAIEAAESGDEEWDAVAEQVAAPWPVPAMEGTSG